MMTGAKIAAVCAVASTWGIVAETAVAPIPAANALANASAHGLLALIASLSIALAWWSMRRVFETMREFTEAMNKLSSELNHRPCIYAKRNPND